MRSGNKAWDPSPVYPVMTARVQDIAKNLSEENPMFKMRGRGVYAIATREGKPSHILRVDKPNMNHKLRKKLKRKAKALAIANS
jgi:hypothetical protein